MNIKVKNILYGMLCALSFAPTYFTLGLFTTSVLSYQIMNSNKSSNAFVNSYFFGFGFFLVSFYWLSIAVSIYIEKFWWVIPFALFGIPIFMSTFTGLIGMVSWLFRKSSLYHLAFSIIWVSTEWIISWIFSGFPWACIGYSLGFSDILLQSSSVFGILGLSFITIYVVSNWHILIIKDIKKIKIQAIMSLIIIGLSIIYGSMRLKNNATDFTKIKTRIVQISTPQTQKWDFQHFLSELNKYIELSKITGMPDLIIWPESALILPYWHENIYTRLMSVFTKYNQLLITGSISLGSETSYSKEKNHFISMIAIDNKGKLIFDYHKSHLVPFGEYIPYKHILPIKKITHGFSDYSAGTAKTVYIPNLNLQIIPIICYESIFSADIRNLHYTNQNSNLLINITNDSWYGNSSEPFQHYLINRVRSIENGLPMLRATSNGISAVIDPYGRNIKQLKLNQLGIIDSNIPYPCTQKTLFVKYGTYTLLTLISTVAILQCIIATIIYKKSPLATKNT
ncbi:apolipoprotein N-acyltransferase [Rickettsia endosymbiont of Cardiosporidium cionae]|uniref:apolipoprotein N-acyltransferase n=1 Tax=Rickettsia endosymbiont of Cardiosporidium cionae TaxID=2777155 RepID=UPI001893CB55|nr:apolipoprotein N-acyltransferase [Rickettsia endosymbiont of Cardiosporidium cionae]KAF8818581.1 apolipoprotein N-acyltransferase [Rickettsia endosymbiont of Cardiosporidium cionae]